MKKWLMKRLDIVRRWFIKEDETIEVSGINVFISDRLTLIEEIDEVDGIVVDWYSDVGSRAGFKNS